MSIKTVSSNITKLIAEKILSNEYQQGSLLPGENELAKKHQISRTTVRSALQALSAKGLISIVPKKGSVVNASEMWNWLDSEVLQWLGTTQVTELHLSHLMATRLIFEPNIAALAALNASAKSLASMEQGYELMLQAAEKEDQVQFNQGDIQFHQALLKASGNPFVITLGDALSAAMSLSFRQTMEEKLQQSSSDIEDHLRVLEAVRLRQPEVARERMREIVLRAIQKSQITESGFIEHVF